MGVPTGRQRKYQILTVLILEEKKETLYSNHCINTLLILTHHLYEVEASDIFIYDKRKIVLSSHPISFLCRGNLRVCSFYNSNPNLNFFYVSENIIVKKLNLKFHKKNTNKKSLSCEKNKA